MSRIARKPLEIPSGVEFSQQQKMIKIKGPKGSFDYVVHDAVNVAIEQKSVSVLPVNDHPMSAAMVGTTRVLLENMVVGCSKGFEKSLRLVGVGYKAKAQGKILDLTLGFSHPVNLLFLKGLLLKPQLTWISSLKG
jgi:large subunit ribosomal protein L6